MIMRNEYREDFLDQVRQLDEAKPSVLKEKGLTVENIAHHAELENMWACYQKSVEDYDVGAAYAAKDALAEHLSIPVAAWDDLAPVNDEVYNWPRVYICSPYRGDVEYNIAFAKAAAMWAVEQHAIPIIPHLMFPAILDDDVEEERKLGIDMDLGLILSCTALWVFKSRGISAGMAAEIDFAKAHGVAVCFTDDPPASMLSRYLPELTHNVPRLENDTETLVLKSLQGVQWTGTLTGLSGITAQQLGAAVRKSIKLYRTSDTTLDDAITQNFKPLGVTVLPETDPAAPVHTIAI